MLAELLQLVSGAVAFAIYRRYRLVTEANAPQVQRLLIAGQALFSGVWGAIVFLCWMPGNFVNQLFIVMLMALVSYSVVFARSVHLQLLTVALAVQGGMTLLRLVTAGGALAHLMAPMILAYASYLWIMGRASHRQLGTMIAARFANEDLAAALRVARDDALHKRYEAETANASKTASGIAASASAPRCRAALLRNPRSRMGTMLPVGCSRRKVSISLVTYVLRRASGEQTTTSVAETAKAFWSSSDRIVPSTSSSSRNTRKVGGHGHFHHGCGGR